MSQNSFLDSDQGTTVAGETNENNASVVPSSVVAEAVDEDQLFDELLTRLNLEVVEGENVVTVEGDIEREKQRRATIQKRTIGAGALILAVVVIAAVLIAVFVSGSSNKQPKQPTPTTAPHLPTAAPAALLEGFRSILLEYNVSSSHDLDQSGTAQHDALSWLANIDKFLNASASAESIVDRYVLAVVYYANGGINWNYQSMFLTNESVCAWHDDSVANGMGAFCTNSKNISLGNYSTRLPVWCCLQLIHTTVTDIDSSLLVLIGSNGFDGSIPTKLVLANNRLAGSIPSEVGRLSSLTYLDLGKIAIVLCCLHYYSAGGDLACSALMTQDC
jgi:hypothetical protein